MSVRLYSKRLKLGRKTRTRNPRPKTFKTEDAAKKWADAQGMKEYDIVNLRHDASSTKKFKVVAKA